MKKFDRYLFFNLLQGSLIALIFLLSIDFLVQSSEELGNLTKSYNFLVMSLVLALKIPEKIIEFMPAAILLGSILVIGQLSDRKELIVLLSSGVSKLRIVKAGIILALFFGVLLIIITEYVVPTTSLNSIEIQNKALEKTSEHTVQNIWINDHNKRLLKIGKLANDGSIENLIFYSAEKENNLNTAKIIMAKRAHYNHQTENWNLIDVKAFKINKDKITEIQAETVWQTNAKPETIYKMNKDNTIFYTIKELWNLTNFLSVNNVKHNRESLQLWQRILLPFSILSMLIVALPFVFKTSRGSNGFRLLIGILLGTTYYILQGITSSTVILLNINPIIGALLPILILSIPAIFILLRY